MKKRILKLISCVAFAGTLFTSNTLAVFAQTEGTPANTESTPAPAEVQPTAGQPAEGTPASTENTATPAEGQPTNTENTAITSTTVDKTVISDFVKSLNGQSLSINEIIKKANDAGIPVLIAAYDYPAFVTYTYKNLTKEEALKLLKLGKLPIENSINETIKINTRVALKVFDAPNKPKFEIPADIAEYYAQDWFRPTAFEEVITDYSTGILDEKFELLVDNNSIFISKDIPIREVSVSSIKNKNAFVVNDRVIFDFNINDTYLGINVENGHMFYQSSDFQSSSQQNTNTITKVNPKSNSKVKDKVDTSDATLSSTLLLLGSAIALVRLNKKK